MVNLLKLHAASAGGGARVYRLAAFNQRHKTECHQIREYGFSPNKKPLRTSGRVERNVENRSRLTLAELEAAAGTGLTVLLTFDLTAITREVTRIAECTFGGGVVIADGAGDG